MTLRDLIASYPCVSGCCQHMQPGAISTPMSGAKEKKNVLIAIHESIDGFGCTSTACHECTTSSVWLMEAKMTPGCSPAQRQRPRLFMCASVWYRARVLDVLQLYINRPDCTYTFVFWLVHVRTGTAQWHHQSPADFARAPTAWAVHGSCLMS
jgi:hypothetical protein